MFSFLSSLLSKKEFESVQEYAVKYGTEKGLDKWANEHGYEVEYDPNIGEHILHKIKEEKMIYTTCRAPDHCDCADCEYKKKIEEIDKSTSGFASYKERQNIEQPKKRDRLYKMLTSAPKMYYNPEEFESDLNHIQIAFLNNDIIYPKLAGTDDGSIEQIMITYTYTKVNFKNSKYPYVFVMDDLREQFSQMFGTVSTNNKKRKYI